MTTTEHASAITPCPVAWCDEAGRHAFDDQLGLSSLPWHDRTCEKKYEVAGCDGPPVVLSVYHAEVGGLRRPTFSVQADDIEEPADMAQLIAALLEASDTAWPGYRASGPSPEQREYDIAVAEVIHRAATPADVNRLVSAAIRLRTAATALVEVTRLLRPLLS